MAEPLGICVLRRCGSRAANSPEASASAPDCHRVFGRPARIARNAGAPTNALGLLHLLAAGALAVGAARALVEALCALPEIAALGRLDLAFLGGRRLFEVLGAFLAGR